MMQLGAAIAELCDGVIGAEADCFERWCQIMDGRSRVVPGTVVASQEALHHAAEQLRRLCQANPADADAARRDLMRLQVEGEIRHETEVKMVRAATARQAIRSRWVIERMHLFQSRDALTVGLGWPHRGELVTVATSYSRGGKEINVSGTAVYLHSYDICNVAHQVWVPEVSANRHAATLIVAWEPLRGGGRWGNADPGGDIRLRVKAAQDRPLPVPLPRWPKAEDIDGGPSPVLSPPVGGQLALFASSELTS